MFDAIIINWKSYIAGGIIAVAVSIFSISWELGRGIRNPIGSYFGRINITFMFGVLGTIFFGKDKSTEQLVAILTIIGLFSETIFENVSKEGKSLVGMLTTKVIEKIATNIAGSKQDPTVPKI